ncbi:MAG: amidohydrolase family protein, partial [bacterium]
VFPDGFIHIREGRVEALGDRSKMPRVAGAVNIDAGGRYVLPGFINPHMHFYGALARGMRVGRMRSFGAVLKDLWWWLDRELTLEDVHISALLGGIEAIRAGVTTVFDHHASYGAIKGSLDAISEALALVGLRASLCFEISDRAGRRARDAALDESAMWLERVHEEREIDPLRMRGGMVGLHASMTLSDATLGCARALMDVFCAGAHVHVAEGIEDVRATRQRFNMSPVARFAKRGILCPGSLAVHCVHVDSKDINLLAKSRCTAVHNPLSNLNNAVGVAPMLELIHRRVPVVIGTDGMSAGISADVRLASVLQRIEEQDAQAGFAEATRAVWKTAPAFASGHFGLPIGALEKGSSADIIIMDAIPSTPVSKENAAGHLLFGILPAPVRTTIVAGRICMHDHEIIGVDEAAVAKEAKNLAVKLWKRML